jgi:hypothetical protein
MLFLFSIREREKKWKKKKWKNERMWMMMTMMMIRDGDRGAGGKVLILTCHTEPATGSAPQDTMSHKVSIKEPEAPQTICQIGHTLTASHRLGKQGH